MPVSARSSTTCTPNWPARGNPSCARHGFVLQAIGRPAPPPPTWGNASASLKQAAGKTVDRLVALGYLERVDDPADARRRLVRMTAKGRDGLHRSAVVFDELHDRWAATLGADRVAAIEDDLRRVVPADVFRLDVPGWFGG
ncbi:MarR family winged helix-turn-helix transcriptional regulator [Micromonospora sp. BRA006-A]|nr:MarR family winged helix-turn-helix transcriptional regulator [Micromonospora sp. BRA006-A]